MSDHSDDMITGITLNVHNKKQIGTKYPDPLSDHGLISNIPWRLQYAYSLLTLPRLNLASAPPSG